MRILFLSLLFVVTTAAGEEFRPNVDYVVLDPPQPVRVEKGKVEVREFFKFFLPALLSFAVVSLALVNEQDGMISPLCIIRSFFSGLRGISRRFTLLWRRCRSPMSFRRWFIRRFIATVR